MFIYWWCALGARVAVKWLISNLVKEHCSQVFVGVDDRVVEGIVKVYLRFSTHHTYLIPLRLCDRVLDKRLLNGQHSEWMEGQSEAVTKSHRTSLSVLWGQRGRCVWGDSAVGEEDACFIQTLTRKTALMTRMNGTCHNNGSRFTSKLRLVEATAQPSCYFGHLPLFGNERTKAVRETESLQRE